MVSLINNSKIKHTSFIKSSFINNHSIYFHNLEITPSSLDPEIYHKHFFLNIGMHLVNYILILSV